MYEAFCSCAVTNLKREQLLHHLPENRVGCGAGTRLSAGGSHQVWQAPAVISCHGWHGIGVPGLWAVAAGSCPLHRAGTVNSG